MNKAKFKEVQKVALEEGLRDLSDPFLMGMEFNPVAVISSLAEELMNEGIEFPYDFNPVLAEDAVLVAEAVNCAAKRLCESWYSKKAAAFCAAALMKDVSSGWDGGVFYVSAPGAGEISAHDPNGELRDLAEKLGLVDLWVKGWSGIRRQNWAFEALSDYGVRQLLDQASRLGKWSNLEVERNLRKFKRPYKARLVGRYYYEGVALYRDSI